MLMIYDHIFVLNHTHTGHIFVNQIFSAREYPGPEKGNRTSVYFFLDNGLRMVRNLFQRKRPECGKVGPRAEPALQRETEKGTMR